MTTHINMCKSKPIMPTKLPSSSLNSVLLLTPPGTLPYTSCVSEWYSPLYQRTPSKRRAWIYRSAHAGMVGESAMTQWKTSLLNPSSHDNLHHLTKSISYMCMTCLSNHEMICLSSSCTDVTSICIVSHLLFGTFNNIILHYAYNISKMKQSIVNWGKSKENRTWSYILDWRLPFETWSDHYICIQDCHPKKSSPTFCWWRKSQWMAQQELIRGWPFSHRTHLSNST